MFNKNQTIQNMSLKITSSNNPIDALGADIPFCMSNPRSGFGADENPSPVLPLYMERMEFKRRVEVVEEHAKTNRKVLQICKNNGLRWTEISLFAGPRMQRLLTKLEKLEMEIPRLYPDPSDRGPSHETFKDLKNLIFLVFNEDTYL